MAPALLESRARILFLDAYDSFSNNIVAQLEQNIDADVVQIHIDDPRFFLPKTCKALPGSPTRQYDEDRASNLAAYLEGFDAVVAGPGPGWANNDDDVGLIKDLWSLQEDHLLPVLGICLGFQSLCLAFGAETQRLTEPRHGLISEILHKEGSIFDGVEQLLATQYHSLQIDIGHSIQTRRSVSYPTQLWKSTEKCPELEPLAWDFDSRRNGAVLMGVQHTQKPFWGVQFHPESICTNNEADRIIQNWWASAQAWNRKRPSKHDPDSSFLALHASHARSKDQTQALHEDLRHVIGHLTNNNKPPSFEKPARTVQCATTGSGRLTVSDICEVFEIPHNEAIVLESGLQPNLLPLGVGTGRYSIIGFIIPGETTRLHYNTYTRNLQIRTGHDKVCWEAPVADPWTYIKSVMDHLKPTKIPSGPTFAPFWGGLMGYASYEAGLETIDVRVDEDETYPDMCFAFITRSIVIDHQLKKIYVQSFQSEDDAAWIEDAREAIYQAACLKSQTSTPNPTPLPKPDPFDTDAELHGYLSSIEPRIVDHGDYCQAVEQCQELIADGQSYELCLTSENQYAAKRSTLRRGSPADNATSWKLYRRLVNQNPAPFSAYLRIHNVHVLSSSPERFISWDRDQSAQCRPIKGTVKKGPAVTATDALAILSSSKERAENLMIVDLTRHQLHGVYGSGNVHVSQLMEVEEYETLWQLVSVVNAIPPGIQKASTPEQWEDPSNYISSEKIPSKTLGIDAFVKSLPPGSMTGAPKRRSCQILQAQEGGARRGIYSGVLGYFDVGGGGDFSVVIRTAVKIDNPEDINEEVDVWRIGAGGAITSQSIPDAEYAEMRTKLDSTARMFQPRSAERLTPERTKPALDDLATIVGDVESLGRLESILRSLHIPQN